MRRDGGQEAQPEASDSDRPTKKRKHASHEPVVCYTVDQLPPIDTSWYEALNLAVDSGRYEQVESFEVPPCDGKAWMVRAGQLFRIVCVEGPQVADVNFWNAANPKERFYTSKTRQLHASHLKTYDRLWSNMPYLRPLATITNETIKYGFDEHNASVHDCIGSRCDPYTNKLLTGVDMNTCCHSNLTRAAKAFGLEEEDVHDVLNVFMCTGFLPGSGQYFAKPSPVRKGDYIEFFAEVDLIVALSTCPQGDVSVACGTNQAPACYPLGVEIYEPDRKDLGTWQPPNAVNYMGAHGLASPPVALSHRRET